MHLDRRFLIIVGSSLAWGMVVSLLFYRMATGSRRAEPEKALVVAAEPLAPGASIAAGAIKVRHVPENLFPKGAYSRVEDVIGRPVISTIEADEPVVDSRLAARGSGFGVAPMIPTGMRAVSVRVNDVAGVAGFVLPGMRVDVLVTGKPPGADDTYTATVLQNVTVLSAGQTIEADGKSQSMSVPVVTLLVDPIQAESLTLAANEGHIQLVLRNSGDQQVADTARRELRELYTRGAAPDAPTEPHPIVAQAPPEPQHRRLIPALAHGPVAPPAALAAPPPPSVDTIVLIRGNQKTVETFAVEVRNRAGSK
ncbi:MAG TPA: Flp pilus assembly protein CpaB [Bryobacteraceae bacterium]|jgi:pilus assembly protein CpaB|nr:Flp pilus assembly protein CpaB [Bryobacteraceae bacterium]